ncbi:hypothetical protein [Actinomadura rudentiformis]|uniref:Ricin-type beta-trefoil lectin domain protein n=1 Tax=Actinomadura rudentiformis TaxID=359158 RepID=A0A6H9YW22_9ACTN|nr:hypothetical protein [Actinomadura rudentiformis]KAB2345949.1 hypothetical protein F8566_24835 [Actinomadura rudentiformis]
MAPAAKIVAMTACAGAALSIGALTGTPASAEATQVTAPATRQTPAVRQAPADPQVSAAACRNAWSKISGASVTGRICWNSSKIWASGKMYDTKGDHRSACIKIYYVKNYARTPMLDCIDNSKPGKTEGWRFSVKVKGTKKFYVKACSKNKLRTSWTRSGAEVAASGISAGLLMGAASPTDFRGDAAPPASPRR